MLNEVEAHILLFDIQLLEAGPPQQYNCLHSLVTRRPIPPPSPTPPPSAALPTDNKQHVYQRGSGLLGAGWGLPRTPTWMPTRQGELARDPATRDGANHRRRDPVTRQKTEHHTSTRTHQPRGSTRRFAQRRRRTNLHQTRGRLDASSRQPWGSATSCPPRARQGTTAATWALRARQSSSLRAPGTGAPMPAPWTWHMRRRGPSGRSTTPTRRLSGVKHADVGLTEISSRRRPLRGRRLW